MAEYGEWNRKGATLSDATASAEYEVDRDFIIKGIKAGKLEYREESIYGNPYLKILRSQLEQYILEELGAEYLGRVKKEAELRTINKQIREAKKKLKDLELRRTELESSLNK